MHFSSRLFLPGFFKWNILFEYVANDITNSWNTFLICRIFYAMHFMHFKNVARATYKNRDM